MNTKTVLETIPEDLLSVADREFLMGAISARSGFLLKNAPATDDADRCGAWNSLVGCCAPSRMQIGVMMLRPDVRAAFERAEEIVQRVYLAPLVRHSEPAYRWNADHGGNAADVVGYIQSGKFRAAVEG